MTEKTEKYYIPEGSPWPVVASVGLFMIAVGLVNFIHQNPTFGTPEPGATGHWGKYLLAAGAAWLVVVLGFWWRDTIRESIGGLHKGRLDVSYRYGMMWFIFTEVMFFGALFGTLFYTRWFIVPWLGGAGNNAMTHEILWPNFQAIWPLVTTPGGTTTQAMDPWGIASINTALLLSSSVTLTIAHHALLENKRGRLALFHFLTLVLGATFLVFQGYEYHHAYTEMGLTLHAGIYGTLFFVMTGFHGLHVTMGATMLTVMLIRVLKGHFSPENNFAWEAAAWYWHFVDVVWLFLFVCVYWM